MRLRKREIVRTACQWHGGSQKQERCCCHLFTVSHPWCLQASLTLGSRLIYAKVAYKVVACMSVLIGNYYTKTNPPAILPNSVQKSLGKPGYMCRAINYTMEQTLQREDTAQMSGAPGSWIQFAHRSHQPLPTEEACFALGSASGWRGRQGTPVQSLGNAPPPIHIVRLLLTSSLTANKKPHAASHFPEQSFLLRKEESSDLEKKSRLSPWAIVQGKPLSGRNRRAQPWVESSQQGGPSCLGFISFPQLEKDQHGLKFRERESKAESGFRKPHHSQVF